MSFSSVWVFVPASTLEWAHRFSGKGFWLAQPSSPSPRRCFSGKWGPISQGMTLPKAHLFCFFLHLCCFLAFFFVLFFCAFLLFFFFAFYLSFSPISFKKYPVLEVPNSDRGPSLSAGQLSTWQACLNIARSSASRVHLGPLFSSLMFPYVSFVFCAGFATLSRLICCFHVCCIWHFPFSLVAFHLSIFSTYHVASFQLALVTSMCSSFVKCAPFQVAFALSIFPPFAIFASFQLACCFPIFFCNCHVCPFQICIFQFHFFCIVSPFFQDVNILEQAQFDSTRLTKKLFLGFLPIYNKCFWQIVPTTCLGA